jgi:hypothetical protein
MIRVVHPGSGSLLFTHPGSGSLLFTRPGYRIQGSKRHRFPDSDPQHWSHHTDIRPPLFKQNPHCGFFTAFAGTTMDRQCSPTGAEKGAEATTGKGLISSCTCVLMNSTVDSSVLFEIPVLSLLDRLHLEEEARFQSFFSILKFSRDLSFFRWMAEMFWHFHK